MAEIIAEFFGIIGVDMIPPDNLAELMEGCRVKVFAAIIKAIRS